MLATNRLIIWWILKMIKACDFGRLLARSLSLAAIAGLVGISPQAMAIDPADDIGVFGSISVARTGQGSVQGYESQ